MSEFVTSEEILTRAVEVSMEDKTRIEQLQEHVRRLEQALRVIRLVPCELQHEALANAALGASEVST